MNEHDIFVSAHWHNDGTAGLVVECSCGAVLSDQDEQLALDEICELAWGHCG